MFMLKHEPSPLALGSHHRLICIMKHEGGSLANVNITILDTDMYKEKASIWTARFNLGLRQLLGSFQRRHEVKAPTFKSEFKVIRPTKCTNNSFLVSLMT
ncbi:hypothetical protein BofuT4_P132100.1 [Botrytis cinerea T4]|uniref:Uncharacterized protein n=1 Tax=Botryotinia fuckeliana (strain T4) TaxID=999810 RepID=G2YQY2_BOTF4|nr:hypothetical protein BofuT4_P132100.1 [Botrytis cinerea T4]